MTEQEQIEAQAEQELAKRLGQLLREIAESQAAGPHAAPRVKLLAVSKTVEAWRAAACWRVGQPLGLAGLAENKVQELGQKSAALAQQTLPPWHFIGHLQTNKVKQLLATPRLVLLHSLDSWHLAVELEKQAEARDLLVECLVEVNVAAEGSKFGLAPAELWDFLQSCAALPHVNIRGLMTVAPAVEQAEQARPIFAEMRSLRDKMRQRAENVAYSNLSLQELSMGMSNDYRVAVEEGATLVRIGSRIFGERIYR